MSAKSKLVNELSYKDFLKRYLVNHEEFRFHYKEYIINLCWGKKGKYEYNIIHNKRVIVSKDYKSPSELLKNFSFENKSMMMIYKDFY